MKSLNNNLKINFVKYTLSIIILFYIDYIMLWLDKKFIFQILTLPTIVIFFIYVFKYFKIIYEHIKEGEVKNLLIDNNKKSKIILGIASFLPVILGAFLEISDYDNISNHSLSSFVIFTIMYILIINIVILIIYYVLVIISDKELNITKKYILIIFTAGWNIIFLPIMWYKYIYKNK